MADAATLSAFYLTAIGTVRYWRDTGTVLKETVRACVHYARSGGCSRGQSLRATCTVWS